MKKKNTFWKRFGEEIIIAVLIFLFVYLVMNFNRLEPDIYRIFDIHVGSVGNYNIPKLTRQFLSVAVLACVSSLVFGIAIGIFCFTRIGKEFRPVIDKVSTVMRAFPEIAMLRFVVPLLGLGIKPTIVALTAHGVLPIIFAVLSGVDNIDPNLIRVAKGMGMNKWQIMFKVQLPLALPVIISGLRVAMISCIGGSTLATSTGAEGLGILLSAGQEAYNVVFIMECAVLICLMSLIADRSLRRLESRMNHTVNV